MLFMEITLQIPQYTVEDGFRYQWEYGFKMEAKVENGVITLAANKAGLISLANHLLNLAQDVVPAAYHLHLDSDNALEAGSCDIIIQKSS